jgi:hypothetical protein
MVVTNEVDAASLENDPRAMEAAALIERALDETLKTRNTKSPTEIVWSALRAELQELRPLPRERERFYGDARSSCSCRSESGLPRGAVRTTKTCSPTGVQGTEEPAQASSQGLICSTNTA